MNKERLERLKEYRKLLIIVDMVNGFVREGKMADKNLESIIPEQLRLIEMFKNNNDGIMFVKDCHELGCNEFTKFPEHCVKGTSEANLVDEFLPYEKEAIVIHKNSTNATKAPGFMEYIQKMEMLKEIVVTGVCTDICVLQLALSLQSYLDQNNLDIKLIMPKNAVGTYDAPGHNKDEYSGMAFKLSKNAGIYLPEKY